MTKSKRLLGFDYSKEKELEMVEVKNEVRIAFCGAWLSREDAEGYREDFYTEFGQAIKDGALVVIQDDITLINAHHVVRILAQNAQLEMRLELE
jgi:hypothetical protein